MRITLAGLLPLLCGLPMHAFSQEQQRGAEQQGLADQGINFPSKLFTRLESKTAALDKQLTRQTEKYLAKMARREARLKNKLNSFADSNASKNLFNNSAAQYAALSNKIATDTGSSSTRLSGEYLPYADSLKGSLSFLQQNPQWLNGSVKAGPQLQAALAEYQQLQAKMMDAEQVKEFVRQRREQIRQALSQYTNLPPGLSKEFQGLNEDLYYYSQQVRQYKEMLNNPDQLEKKALSLLGQLPAFQQFMKNNSQLAGLFNLPGNYGSATALVGLQTRDQVTQLIQNQVSAGGPGGMAVKPETKS